MRVVCAAVLIGTAAGAATFALAQENRAPHVLTERLSEGVARVYAAPTATGIGVFVQSAKERAFRIRLADDGALRLVDAPPPPPDRVEAGILPDGAITRGARNIRAAWLVGATDRYAHGVLGDAIEAEGVAVETADGRRLEFRLPADSVFEDRYPRLADIDGDGEDEVIVVRSYLDHGAALTVLKARPEGLSIVAQTPALGLRNRWLNPVGAADFDGDGRIEVALVETPHIGGVLKLYRWNKDRLSLVAELPGVSNHVLGSRVLGLSAIFDTDGDGRPDILVPDRSRRTLVIFRFTDGRLERTTEVAHPSPIVSDFVVADLGDGRSRVVYALADGTIVAVGFAP
ncbi:MAG: VCBS repeat-containing protein [Alphaproteobacteria bacterium]|nr:VCBS repeat-containing protein [Alphaproteobacteria bacterium]